MRSPRGQVLIEVLLILPIFMFLVFVIMEIGHLSFRTILLQHAAYEVARVGSLTSTGTVPCGAPTSGGGRPGLNQGKMRTVANQILRGVTVKIDYGSNPLRDPQSGCVNYDVQVTLTQPVPMIFPMTGVVLGNANSRGARLLTATVRMPIEQPLFK